MAQRSDDIMADAKAAHRRVVARHSIGTKSRDLKRKYWLGKLGRAALAVGAVFVGATVIGTIINGIGFSGVMLTAGAAIAAGWAFMKFPSMPLPTPEKLAKMDLKTLAGKTEIWLESQRPALPAPAVNLVDGIGVRLDGLAPQLQTLHENDPAAIEVRKLVGEHLPELITGFRRIPEPLRREERNGRTPEKQLVDGLKLIDQEIGQMTQQIADGDLDKLATRGRYLELKYDKTEAISG